MDIIGLLTYKTRCLLLDVLGGVLVDLYVRDMF